jgi:predicted DNA-binding helix-hairpin-helix protein
LYEGGGVHHAHFSAFRPIRDTPLEHAMATPALREHRLYQADNLVRRYGFSARELVFDQSGNLPLARDPKLAWALSHPDAFPVELRTAPYSQLVRVPGVGPSTARAIVTKRRQLRLRGASDLRGLGVLAGRAAGFLALGGKRLGADRVAEQLAFWSPEDDVGALAGMFEFSPGTFR